jgi:hypothetical protein
LLNFKAVTEREEVERAGSQPRKQSPALAIEPRPPEHFNPTPLHLREDQLDPDSLSMDRRQADDEPPNIPSPTNTGTPPQSPSRRRAAWTPAGSHPS